jgi:carboxypeptidase Q
LRRMVEMGLRPRMALQMAVDYSTPTTQANLIAEIPGTDLKDQIVMLGAHLDSWHVGTGATDNAAGVAICIEALRILKVLKLTPRRTIRVALWDAEEFTAKGSRVYVTEHFGRVATTSSNGAIPVRTLKRGPEYEKLSAYYNVDLGSGKIRGIYLEGNEQLRNIFREWMVPLRPLGASTISADDGGGSDHLRFDQVGLPGLFFIQDDLNYDRVLHSTSDVLERAQPEDLKQAAVVMAAFVYQTAMCDERLPRRPVAIGVE